MAKEKVRIKLKAYDHRVLDSAAAKIVATVKRTGGVECLRLKIKVLHSEGNKI